MENKPNHHSIVAKDNSMVEKLAGFKLNELRLIAYCLSHYDTTDPNNRTFYARVSDLQELFPIDKKEAYSVVKAAMLGINQKPLQFEEDGKEYFWNWFSGFAYDKGNGEFEFRITPEIRPYLLGLKDTFTKYRLGAVYQFKSAHTWKLYENLKREAFKRQWAVPLDELKMLLGVPGKYERWGNFNDRIIVPAVVEINELSDLEVSWEKRKRGRSVVGLVFFIDDKQPEDVVNIETPKQSFARLLAVEGVHEKTILDYVILAEKRGKVKQCIEQLPRIVERWNKGKGPKVKYLLGALKSEINQKTLFDDHQAQAAAPAAKVDFSDFGDDDLDIFETIPGHKDAVRAEKKKRGLI